jgi:membrane associated rhomboid family serine protease
MFPIGDDDRALMRTPIITYTLILLNVIIFVYELSLGEGVQSFIERWGVIPAQIASGQGYITLLSSMFLHGGIGHIFGNMLFLWIFGDNVEEALGSVRYLLFYLVTGLAASFAHIALNINSSIPSIGASGAISGVLGAYLIWFGANRVRVLIFVFVTFVPAWIMIGLWAIQQFLATYAEIASTAQTEGGGVAYAAHAGGFLAGVILAFVLGDGGVRSRSRQLLQQGRR